MGAVEAFAACLANLDSISLQSRFPVGGVMRVKKKASGARGILMARVSEL